MVSTGPDPDAAAQSVIIAEKTAPRAHGNGMLRNRFHAHIAALLAALALFAGCATLGPSQQQVGEGPHARSAIEHLRAANTALQRGDAQAALKQLAAVPSDAPPDVRRQALDLQARAQLASGDRLAAARSLIQRAALLPPAAQAPEQQHAVAILAGMGRESLAQVYPTLADNDPVKPWVQKAMAHPGAAAAQVLPQPNQPVGTMQGAAVPQGYAMPAKVALLLPATGPVAVAGAAVRDGFFTAYFHTPVTRERRPTISVYDTGGTADGSVTAYHQAVADGATLVVGPLGRDAVGALFAQPNLPVPVLALNHPQGSTPTPAGSYEFALLPEAEGAQLAAHLITLGLHAAIVFRGSDDTASRTFDAFRSQFESLGGQVANDIVLQQGSVDFAGQVQAALAGSGSQTGIVALLRPAQARLLLPQLRLARSTLPVFSTSMVYSGDGNPTADADLDGVRFCDEPWLYDAQAGLPDHTTLASQLVTAGGPAARLFAFGMDAYALVPYLGWMRSHPGSYVPGASGQLTMDAFGHVQRTPIWVEFQGGVARPVAAGLETQPEDVPAPTDP